MKDFKYFLKESVATVKKHTGQDYRYGSNFKNIMVDDASFKIFQRSMLEGLDESMIPQMEELFENTRQSVLENSSFQINPYETLTFPVLRNFYPKLIARELVNVMPIDKPDVIKGFIHARFKRVKSDGTGAYSGYDYEFPSNTDVSRGPNVGITLSATAVPGETDILSAAGLTAGDSHIEKDFLISAIYDSTNGVTSVTITADVDGNFSVPVEHDNGATDVISGNVNFEDGTLTWASTSGDTIRVKYQAVASLEENKINPVIRYEVEKIRFTVVGRKISGEFTHEIQQDLKALYDLDVQSELVSLIGEQIALDIDREIINALLSTNAASNPASHVKTFNIQPPSTYTFGQKNWSENILHQLNQLSAQIYNSTLMGAGNTLACNPLDAAVLENINGFNYVGESVEGGDVGYRVGSIKGKWKVLVSTNVPQGKMLCKYRSNDLQRACFVYAPYVPALLVPYPLGPIPSLTVMTRYASRIIRSKAVGVVNITDVAP